LVQIGLFIVGSCYTYFAWRQWQAIKQQAKLTEDTLIADKRALVFADNLRQLFDPPDASGCYNWRLRPLDRNSGATPTRELISHVHCEVRSASEIRRKNQAAVRRRYRPGSQADPSAFF
jgi:hypothetical protein